MLKLGEIGNCVFGAELIVGFAVGLTFFLENNAAILELGFFRIVIDWDVNETS
jgi:hypothetical protein